jgi:hypothetical protein
MGIMAGSNLKIIGVFAPWGIKRLVRSSASLTEFDASLISVPKVNSRITMLEPMLEVDVIFSRPETPVRVASRTLVTERSTSSGPAPV